MTYFNNPVITDWQRQIILGTILGGSCLIKPKKGKNCYLVMSSADEKDWLQYKANELNGLSSQRPFTEGKNNTRWHSCCFPIFTEFYEIFYLDGEKQVRMEILDTLRDIGLAIWYGDCGKIEKNNVILNTHAFGLKGTEIISRYFQEIGIGENSIFKHRNAFFRLKLDEKASEKFLSIIAVHLANVRRECS